MKKHKPTICLIFSAWIYSLNRRMFFLFTWNTISFAVDSTMKNVSYLARLYIQKYQYKYFWKGGRQQWSYDNNFRNIKSIFWFILIKWYHYYFWMDHFFVLLPWFYINIQNHGLDHDTHSHEAENGWFALDKVAKSFPLEIASECWAR